MSEFGEAMKRFREDAALSLRALARVTYASAANLSRFETGDRRPNADVALRIDEALHAGGQLIALVPARDELAASVRDTERLAALLCGAPPSAFADEIGASVGDLAVRYLRSPPGPMLKESLALRKTATTVLKRSRRETAREVTLWIGYLSGILGYAALDLGNSQAAMAHADVAYSAGEQAGSNELRAWVRGTQSLIARFQGRYVDALRRAERGLQYCDSGTARIRLLCGVAQSAANLGDRQATHEALDAAARARDVTEGADALGGMFTFSEAKQAYYSGSSLIWLDGQQDAQRARREADTAIARWRSADADERSLDDEALAHVYAATASVQLHELEAAAQYLEPILGLPQEQRISWIRKRMARVAELLAEPPYRGDLLAGELRDRIVDYR